jgi:PAS domain S-box-containing protein
MSDPMRIDPVPTSSAGELSALAHASLESLRAILDDMPARVMLFDLEGFVLYVNHEFFKFTGLKAHQVIGRHAAEIISSATWKSYEPIRAKLLRGEAVRWEGWTYLAMHGKRYMREHIVPCGVVDGKPSANLVMSVDLTSLKEREAQVNEQAERLQITEALKSSIVDHALAALVTTDDEGRIVEFNPAAETMFGHQRTAVLGRAVSEVIVPPRFRAAHNAGLQRMRNGGPSHMAGRRVEMEALRADGTEFPIEMVLWRTEVHRKAYYTASLTDLSERRDAAQQIEHQREALRQSEKLTAMGSLLAGVAHELNNPLSIVLGRANLLEEKCEELPDLKADAQRIREAAERCGRIVRTFLNMARSKPQQRAAISLNDLARAAADMLGYTYRSHDIELELALDPALPPAMADGDQIGQVVLNLLVNAQQALSAHNPPRRVWMSTGVEMRREDREPRVWLRVVDNGPGPPEGMRDKIFEPFFTTKPEGMGTGLGLAVSRSLARDHGGELILEDGGIGSGTSFRLSLPLSGEAETQPAPLRSEAPDGLAVSRVLVVDDEAEIADLVRAMLEGAGYDVATAESGAVALELLGMAHFDAIVSDLRMPDMDGSALWRAVSTRHPHLAQRILFVTGDTLSPGARQFLADTHCPSLDKPFNKADLLARVGALLAG